MLVVHLLFILRLVLNNSRSFLWLHAARKEDEVSTPIKVLSYLSKPLLLFLDIQPRSGLQSTYFRYTVLFQEMSEMTFCRITVNKESYYGSINSMSGDSEKIYGATRVFSVLAKYGKLPIPKHFCEWKKILQ